MQFDEVVRSRRMIRRFRPDPVDPAIIEDVLTLAQRAPSAGFSQGFEFLVLDRPDTTMAFFDLTGARAWWEKSAPAVLHAPVLVIPLADKQAYLDRYAMPDKAGSGLHREDAWPQPYWLTDTAFATMILQLAAVDRGLGTLFFGIFRNERAFLDAFDVPSRLEALGVVALGWAEDTTPTGSPTRRERRPLDEVVHWDGYGQRRSAPAVRPLLPPSVPGELPPPG